MSDSAIDAKRKDIADLAEIAALGWTNIAGAMPHIDDLHVNAIHGLAVMSLKRLDAVMSYVLAVLGFDENGDPLPPSGSNSGVLPHMGTQDCTQDGTPCTRRMNNERRFCDGSV